MEEQIYLALIIGLANILFRTMFRHKPVSIKKLKYICNNVLRLINVYFKQNFAAQGKHKLKTNNHGFSIIACHLFGGMGERREKIILDAKK